ncbi:MAG: ATP-binding cassette domain-containing protein [Burkholderiaceae bacterium]
MRHIDKRFGAVHANRDVQLTVQRGTVHGIVGENGAGKSTLMSILYGFYQADGGEIEIEGRPARISGSREAIALGIGMVHQHFMLVDTLSALDNVMLGAEPGWRLQAARAQVRTRLDALMQETGLHVELDALVQDLPVGDRQRLEILKTLYRGARILILDEPTAVLTPQETDALFDTLRGLRQRGTTVLLITHKLKEIMALCDTVTVMRAGQVVLDCPIASTSLDGLAEAMVGRRVNLGRDGKAATPGAVLLQAQGLSWTDNLGVPRLRDVALTLRAGEIVGVAGVSGNGQSELLDVLSGLQAPHQGSLAVGSARFGPHDWLDTRTARELRIAHVPEDRHRRGLVLPFDAWESAVLGYQSRPRYSLRGLDASAPHARRLRGHDGALRRAAAQPRAALVQVQRWQPAEAGAGTRSIAGAAGAAGRPTDTGRGHRRHRVHPRPAARHARRRWCGAGGVVGAGRDPGAERPRGGDECRAHHGRIADRGLLRGGFGAAHGWGGCCGRCRGGGR